MKEEKRGWASIVVTAHFTCAWGDAYQLEVGEAQQNNFQPIEPILTNSILINSAHEVYRI
jgi:hypothetical protein